MKNLENITTVFSVMKGLNVSLDDLVAYRNNQNQAISPERTQLPLEVLYEDNYRSFFIEAGKTPIAIICGNVGFAMNECPYAMSSNDATEYCEKYSVGRKKWNVPNKDSGHLMTLYMNKIAINEVLTAFGKNPFNRIYYWASECNTKGSWNMYLSNGIMYANYKFYYYGYVIPVLVFK